MAVGNNMSKTYKMYLGGKWVSSKTTITVTCPYDGALAGKAATATSADYTKAIALADQAFAVTRKLASYQRERILHQIADGIEKNSEKFARTVSLEMGKVIRDARSEVGRAVSTFRVSAEEAKRVGGDVIDLDWLPGHERRTGIVRRFPIGVIAGITPFNFPINLVAHKIGPAIASGNTIVLKPASKTPIVALLLAEVIDQSDLPKGAISILPGASSQAAPLLEDERVKLVTFTGSSDVGWHIKQHCGKKKVVLELGGNAGVIVADDANLDWAAARLLFGGFTSNGQSCISVQRIFVHDKLYDTFIQKIAALVKKMKVGSPLAEDSDISAMVDSDSTVKVKTWIDDAISQGAKIICGGKIQSGVLLPTVLTDVKSAMKVCVNEVFAPLISIAKYRDFKAAVAEVNDSRYGLQAGVFTNRLNDVMYAFEEIQTGGVVINDVPTYRADHMPYGGVKDSGMQREGVRYAIEDMTETKILVLNLKN
jgi:acyl-CoA reductase-like NAD-dependent aldehyde dehydrogenase